MLSRPSLSLVLALSVPVLSAGCESGSPETSGDTTTTGATTATTTTPTGCDVFDNWQCQVSPGQCFATCEKHQLTCDGTKCARGGSDLTDTSQGTGQICMPFKPQGLMGCDDCRAAFEAGCK